VLSVIGSTIIMEKGDIKLIEPVVAPAVLEEESMGKVSGQLRAFYINKVFSGTKTNTRSSLAVSDWIGTKFYAHGCIGEA